MRRPILQRLAEKVLLGDGAMGTMLQQQGLAVGECPEAWNLSHPDKVRWVSESYVAAGAECVLTNTFGGTSLKLENCGLAAEAKKINIIGTQLAREAAGEQVYVAASIGPTGKMLVPFGEMEPEVAYEAFREQVTALEEGGADIIQIETMSDLEEAKIAVRAAKENTNLPVIASMTFEKGKQGYRTVMGVDIPTAVQELLAAGADVIGTNCGNGIDEIIEIIRQMRQYADGFLMAAPNAGLPQLEEGKVVYSQTPQYFAQRVELLVEAGANLISGCCGTTPEHISAMAAVLKRL